MIDEIEQALLLAKAYAEERPLDRKAREVVEATTRALEVRKLEKAFRGKAGGD